MGGQRQLLRPDQLAAEKSEEECSLLRDKYILTLDTGWVSEMLWINKGLENK